MENPNGILNSWLWSGLVMAVADTREVNRTDPSICPGFSLSLSHSLALSLPDSDFQKDEKLINIYKKKTQHKWLEFGANVIYHFATENILSVFLCTITRPSP